ncbi:hypothetical protein SARC_13445 [Sphaeroforma arctica JP610]|uniref:Uncharacterized protein n=1 Tax=Sphaeroforma arctica JP610 TaxID=667725 RepID=A0A0L0FBX4_9EUKA|nr:hypothetical protein SARC_13445 [Sphaeroforma arctica JP610]KNC73996.1 hypothetical protein SARC_13445 [Sphaeroforma arctica JP610]|eukprot:XP_014147898.1 hypothetical protein SARC_13445 [Sphaeroforma arctica JP610]
MRSSRIYLDSIDQYPVLRQQNPENANQPLGDLSTLTVIPLPSLRLLSLERSEIGTIDGADIPKKDINYHMNLENKGLVLRTLSALIRMREDTFDNIKIKSSPLVGAFAN